jgi:predicted amidophosphoribosyltransferase
MPFCPQCRYEYRAGLRQCPDCGAELVDELLPEEQSPPSGPLVTIYIAKICQKRAWSNRFSKNSK